MGNEEPWKVLEQEKDGIRGVLERMMLVADQDQEREGGVETGGGRCEERAVVPRRSRGTGTRVGPVKMISRAGARTVRSQELGCWC